jgi:hypothetical protein
VQSKTTFKDPKVKPFSLTHLEMEKPLPRKL